jgi:hypothetical protein
MSSPTRSLLHGWPTRRLELMRTRVCDLPVRLEGSAYEPAIERVARDLARRGLPWMPTVYLSTGWHCPERVPLIGVPFSLATRELRRIEREVTNELEPVSEMVRLLRHETGHAYCYALKLWETPEWKRLFGAMSRPYRERYVIKPASRRHVKHLPHHYAQKHPDEDFAETFAVWLTPKARWRREYESWGALQKLEYVDRVMGEARGFEPGALKGGPIEPVEQLRHPLWRHYEQLGYPTSGLGFEDEAGGYVDEDLRNVLRRSRAGSSCDAEAVLRRLRRRIVSQVVSLLSVRRGLAENLYDKYVDRAAALGERTGDESEPRLLVGLTAMMTTHLHNLRHDGRFSPLPSRPGCRR